ncbi:MAG: insulinase family protein [Deltaproteobacteria bacterium]|nr:insulinase family protein [Deltaproteobacteria bacterium]
MERLLYRAISLAAGLLVLLSLVVVPLGTVQSASIRAAVQSPQTIDVRFKEYRLENGLRVLLSEDHHAPTYSICVTYNVGSRDEMPGRTGFAHLFEHMMFQGSTNVGKGEHFILVLNNGGSANGTTNADRTNYFQTLPANQLELGVFLEADRMRSLNITQANLDNQRQTVQEERRQSYDNRPYGKTYEAVIDTAYNNFAYKHSTIGSMEDLNAATLEDTAEFFRTYYAPNNAVLSLVGAFDTEVALELIKKYFEKISSQPAPPVPDVSEPPQQAERRKTIEDPFAQTPRIDIVYKVPAGNTADSYALRVLGQVLSGGLSSRLYQKFVKEKELALSISAGPDERRGPSLFWVSVMVRPGVNLAELEKLVYEELERIKIEAVMDWELDKIRMQLRRQRAQSFYSTRSRANSLGYYAVYYDDPGLINSAQEKILRVSKADIQRVARSYFKETNRTVVTTLPKAKAAAPTATINR